MSSSEEMESEWARCDGCTAVVLGSVFEWLSGRELARAGAVCREWRRAADHPRLWRRLLQAECCAVPHAIRALALHNAAVNYQDPEDKMEAAETEFIEWSWRDEYVRAVAGWRHVYSLRPFDSTAADCGGRAVVPGGGTAMGPTLLHAALAPRGDAFAVVAEDASISVFTRTEPSAADWKLSWHAGLVRRGWRAASRVEWAPASEDGEGEGGAARGGRLLVAGPLALTERWELLVLQLEAGCGAARVLARAGAAAGASGCWASHDAFLSLELRLLAPHRAVTTIWLNSATQEEESEFTGVAAPVLRVYNEAQAHISHVIVVEAPTELDVTEPGMFGVDTKYIRTVCDEPFPSTGRATRRLVVAACGRAGGAPGQATALGCWPLRALTVPPLCAAEGGGLAERVARRRRAPRPDDPEPPVPTEDEMRALCSPPAALCPLQARLLGLAAHPNGRCVWAVEAGGRAVCAALPALCVLRVLSPRDAPAPVSARPPYVHPALSTHFVISPMGDDGGRLGVWSARSGAQCAAPAPARVAVPCALLPPAPAPAPSHAACLLFVLAGDAILKGCQNQTTANPKERCETGPDYVAARLAASKEWRRREYMREVCERQPPKLPKVAPYRLPGERECARATDGNQYTIAPTPSAPPASAPPTTVSRACGPCRTPPPPKCVELVPDNKCQVRASHHVDPCAHRPKVMVTIDRSKTRETNDATSKPSACTQRSSPGGITSRIMKSLNLNRGGGGESSPKAGGSESSPKGAPSPSAAAGGKAQYAGDTGWCGKIQPVPVPPRCRPPGQEERLRRRACRDIPCRQQPSNTRTLHTAIPAHTKKAPKDMKDMAAQTKANVEKLEKMLNTRASFKEAAKGRVVDCAPKVALSATGGLELPVPPGAAAIRVKVSLDPAHSADAPLPSSAPPPPCAQSPPCAPKTMKASPCAARAAAATCGAPTAVPPPSNSSSSKCVSRAVLTDDKSWLSIKTLQKKIAETCRMTETSSKDISKNPCQPKPSPCAPKPSKPSPPCAPHAPPKAPSKKSDCDKKKKKPTCFTPALSTHVDVCT